MPEDIYVIGLDYGTDSVRSILVHALTGEEVSTAVYDYTRWKAGKYCDPARNQFRQHPLDYIEGLEYTILEAVRQAPAGTAQKIKGIAVDTTGSTPVAVDETGTPLSLLPGFEENPGAMFVLWKDHTAVEEAGEINALARSWGGTDYTQYEGGIYSSEWFWAKILHVLRSDEKVRKAAYSWVEHCDWIPALLTGVRHVEDMKRGRCSAGHKAMWHASWGGLPSEAFLVKLDPLLAGLRERLYEETVTSDAAAGTLAPEWAKRLGLGGDVAVSVGAFDAHMGAVGGGAKPFYLTKIIGTSTCDVLIAPMADFGDKFVRGICGQVDGSVIPGMLGLEAGQSAFGDIYAWFKQVLLYPVEEIVGSSRLLDAGTREKLIAETSERLIPELTKAAEQISVEVSGIVAMDWMNGRRTPDANQLLKGAITGLNLGSDAPKIFRALVEATAFGARQIVDRFAEEGVPIEGVIALGGIPKKSPFVMQVLADVLNRPILVARSEQACALGAAMFAATAAGIHPTVEAAQEAMSSGFEHEYRPDPRNAAVYEELYGKYSRLGAFIEKETGS
ncbi:MAG TPA: ribulokinase [bacterium]|nr:ribulokinase [bacterium]